VVPVGGGQKSSLAGQTQYASQILCENSKVCSFTARTVSQSRNANTCDAIAQTFFARAVRTKADKGSGGEQTPHNLLSRQKNSSASFLILSHRNMDRN
jgi:hypothetical protein